jgi:hypothetical protein
MFVCVCVEFIAPEVSIRSVAYVLARNERVRFRVFTTVTFGMWRRVALVSADVPPKRRL